MKDKTEDYQYYSKLLNLSYNDLVNFLIEKYETVKDNYFKENSYNRFLRGEIKKSAMFRPFSMNRRTVYFSFSKFDIGLCHILIPNGKWLYDTHICHGHTIFPGLLDSDS